MVTAMECPRCIGGSCHPGVEDANALVCVNCGHRWLVTPNHCYDCGGPCAGQYCGGCGVQGGRCDWDIGVTFGRQLRLLGDKVAA